MKITISNIKEVSENIDFIKRNKINLISIRDTTPSAGIQNDYDIIDNAGLDNLLIITFDDLIHPIPFREEKPASESNILTILKWSKQKMTENNNGFIVHCTAGISRSAAVAILVQYLQDPSKALKIINPMLHYPNEKILEIGEKLLQTNIVQPTKELLNKYDEQFIEQIGKKQIRLWLDDEKDPKDPTVQKEFGAQGDEVWVKTVEEAISYLQNKNVGYISFDNDLGEEKKEGYELAKWIEEQSYNNKIPPLTWSIHSQNLPANEKIKSAMNKANEFWSKTKGIF